MLIHVINDDNPLDTKHICYYTNNISGTEIELYEIIEETFYHPKSENSAYIKKLDYRLVHKFSRFEFKADAANLISHSQNVARTIYQKYIT